jgi:hypothetical protein
VLLDIDRLIGSDMAAVAGNAPADDALAASAA